MLVPLTGCHVTVNKRVYTDQRVRPTIHRGVGIHREHLGMGTMYTWHGAPDCRCNIDLVNLDLIDEDVSDAESTGAKTLLELKPQALNLRHLHQVIGNTLVYGFVHYNRHPTHNPLVPVLGMSGGLGICMVAFYDPIHDMCCLHHGLMDTRAGSKMGAYSFCGFVCIIDSF